MTYVHYHKLASQGVQFRDRQAYDFYPTNDEHVLEQLSWVTVNPKAILDTGTGLGIYGYYVRKLFPKAELFGVEYNLAMPLMNWYDHTVRADYLDMIPSPLFDLIIGNPPYDQAESFVCQSLKFLKNDGELIYLLPLNFLASMGRYTLFVHEYPLEQVIICSDRPSFTGDGKTDSREYAFFKWKRNNQTASTIHWALSYPRNKDKYGNFQNSLFKDVEDTDA